MKRHICPAATRTFSLSSTVRTLKSKAVVLQRLHFPLQVDACTPRAHAERLRVKYPPEPLFISVQRRSRAGHTARFRKDWLNV